jgi:hypothetical protein
VLNIPFDLHLTPTVLRLRSALRPSLRRENDVMWPLIKVMSQLDLPGCDGFFDRAVIDGIAFSHDYSRTGFGDAMVAAGILRDEDGLLFVVDWSLWRDARAIGYGPEWSAAKKKALQRDGGECQECGAGHDLVVHHIRPILTFKGDTKAANDLRNLVTLCADCHRDAHERLRAEAA